MPTMCAETAAASAGRTQEKKGYEETDPRQEDAVKLLIAGDWHRDAHWAVETVQAAKRQGIKHIIHLGDLGAFWPSDYPRLPDQYDPFGTAYGFTRSLSHAVMDAGVRFMFIDGNHDNHEFLARLPRGRDGLAELMGLTYVPRGARFKLGGLQFGALGGAYSVNQRSLTHGVDWWPQEEITISDVHRLGIERLDVLLAHEAPSRVELRSQIRLQPDTAEAARRSRKLVQDAAEATRPDLMFCGHWHHRHAARVPGTETLLHVLDMQRRPGNAVVLDTKALTVEQFVPTPAPELLKIPA